MRQLQIRSYNRPLHIAVTGVAEPLRMNIETLEDNLTRIREHVLTTIEPLPDEALLEPGVIFNDWTVADVLGVIAAWESELVTGLAEIQRRKKPTKLLEAARTYDDYIMARRKENTRIASWTRFLMIYRMYGFNWKSVWKI